MNQSFGKNEKLKSQKLIEVMFEQGKSVKKFPLKLIYLPIPHLGNRQSKTGFSVPKRLVKKAVERNRIKRLMRETFRKNKYLVTNNILTPYALMFIYISREETSYQELLKSTKILLEKFIEVEK